MSLRSRLAIPGPGSRWVALLVLAGCGWDGPPGLVCDRLGLLCDAQDSVQGLALGPTKGASADLDGDGVRDLVSAGEPGLSIAWGHSGTREYRLFAGGVPDVEIGDVDDDGDLDVVFVTAEPAALHVLENHGGRELFDREAMTVAAGARSVWVGDLDGDDRVDAVVASGGDAGTLTVVTAGLTRAEPLAVGRDLVAVEAGDLDGDGRLDLVAVDHGDSAIHVALARGPGFAAPVRTRTGYAPEYLQLYEFDGDGALDVLTHGPGDEVWFHGGDGAGGLAAARGLVVQDGPSAGFGAHRDEQGRRWLITVDGAKAVASQLDDADRVARRVVAGGSLDFSGLDMDDGSVLTHGPWLGQRHSLASSHVFTELWHGGEGSLQPLALGDLDQDGLLDLVTVDGALQIRRGLPDGSWSEPWTLEAIEYVTAVDVLDATGDGLPDLVLADAAPSVWVAVGAGDGTFTAGPPVPLEDTPHRIRGLAVSGGPAAVAVAIRGKAAPGIVVLGFDAAGVVADQTRAMAEEVVYSLAAADLDADGVEDLVALASPKNEAAYLLIVPRGDDGWGPARTRPLADIDGDSHPTLTVGDIDLDGRIDAAIVASGAILRLPDIGAPAPPPAQVHEFERRADSSVAALADVDGEGPLDIVVCSTEDLRVVLVTPGGELQLQAPYDQFISECVVHVDPETRRATAGISAGRGYSVLRPDVAPALEATSTFGTSPHALRRVATGDIDADGHVDIVVSDERDDTFVEGNTAVLWGTADGAPRRATSMSGGLFDRAEIAVAPLDDRPGDEIVMVWGSRSEIWRHEDGTLRPMAFGSAPGIVLAVGVQRRGDGRSDVILLSDTDESEVSLIALPCGEDGTFLADAEVPLWIGQEGGAAPAMTIADLDGDGYDDIAALVGPKPGAIVVWGDRGRTGPATFVPLTMYDRNDITSGDLDGDGLRELIVVHTMRASLITFKGREPGVPELPPDFPPKHGLLVADLEGDGRVDLLAQHDGLLDIILRSPGDQASLRLELAEPWSQMRAADLDGDGILDLVGLRDGVVVTRRSGQAEVAP